MDASITRYGFHRLTVSFDVDNVMRRLLWFLLGCAFLLIAVTLAGGLYVRRELRASLPQVDVMTAAVSTVNGWRPVSIS